MHDSTGTIASESPGQLTEEQLLSLPRLGKTEMIDGRLIVAPASSGHGNISIRIASRVLIFVEQHGLGKVFDSSTGFWMRSGNLLSPDVAFVAGSRLAAMDPDRFFRGSPDLVVEVLSPNDRPAELERKLQEYFSSGTKLAWIIDPRKKIARVHREPSNTRILAIQESLSGEDVVPGFQMALSDIFAP